MLKTSSNNKTENNENDSFPTSLLKNLLQNSDLLETLLKPMSANDNEIDELKNQLFNEKDAKTSKKEEDLIDTSVKTSAMDSFWNPDSSSKFYGSNVLDPNFWYKSNLYDGNQFSNVRLESLDIDDFLTENGLNVSEAELLAQLSKPETEQTQTNEKFDTSNDSLRNLTATSNQSMNNVFSPTSFNDMDMVSEKSYNALSPTNSHDMEFNSGLFNSLIEKFDPTQKLFSDDELKPQPIMKKSRKRVIPNEMKDEKYWTRRRKNNVAAKRSRDARRIKENQIVLRAAFLERENDSLKKQLEDYKVETKVLKAKLSTYESGNIAFIGKK